MMFKNEQEFAEYCEECALYESNEGEGDSCPSCSEPWFCCFNCGHNYSLRQEDCPYCEEY
jgi:hypothetical protein